MTKISHDRGRTAPLTADSRMGTRDDIFWTEDAEVGSLKLMLQLGATKRASDWLVFGVKFCAIKGETHAWFHFPHTSIHLHGVPILFTLMVRSPTFTSLQIKCKGHFICACTLDALRYCSSRYASSPHILHRRGIRRL